MKRMLGLDQSYEELREIGLTGPQFTDMSYPLVKKYVQTLVYVSLNKGQFKQMLTALDSSNKSSLETLKILILLNIAIHENVKQDKVELDDLITEKLKALIALERTRYDNFQNKRGKRGFSIEKAGNWIKQRFSRSKDKPIEREARTMSSNNNRLRPRAITETTQNIDTPIMVRKQSVDANTEVKGKQQLLISMVIIPYATYLLKLQSSQINLEKSLNSPHLRTEQIWKVINLLTYLLKTSSSFPSIMRYYKEEYEDVIRGVIIAMHYELKLLYPIVEKSIRTKFDLLKKEILQVYDKYGASRNKSEKLEEIVFKFDVHEFKEIIEEIAKINEAILGMYMGKYTYVKVREAGLTPQPNLISQTNDIKFELVYDILKQVEKSRSAAKRLSTSKEKKPLVIQKQKDEIKQEHNKKEGPSSFAQKKLKIVATGQKNIAIPKSMTELEEGNEQRENEGGTFRRMRLNMTSGNAKLEESNTRRLRL